MNRLERLRAEMAANQIDVTVLVPGSNLRYLSGISFSTKLRLACLIVPLTGQPAIVLPTMEAPRAVAQAQFPLHVFGWDDDAGRVRQLSMPCELPMCVGARLPWSMW